MIQSQSAERSFVVETAQIENLPITRGNFINVVAFTPGVITGNTTGGFTGAGATRLGGGNRGLEFRLDLFNAFNTVVISDIQEQI